MKTIDEFFQYRTHCPLCGSILIGESKIDILIMTAGSHNCEYPGSIIYKYKNNSFHKNNTFITHKDNTNLMDVLFTQFPNHLATDLNLYPTIDKSYVSRYIQPKYLHTYDFSFHNICLTQHDHYYSYQSQSMFTNIDNISINEMLTAHDVQICNYQNENKTQILNVSKPLKHFTMPLIPMKNWNIESKITLQEQITKYVMLA